MSKNILKSVLVAGVLSYSSLASANAVSIQCSDGTFAYRKVFIDEVGSNLEIDHSAGSPSKNSASIMKVNIPAINSPI